MLYDFMLHWHDVHAATWQCTVCMAVHQCAPDSGIINHCIVTVPIAALNACVAHAYVLRD
jgi:hypothetical protein